MITIEQRKAMIAAALGRQPLDLLLRNVRLVNVYTGIIEPADLGIKAGCIVSLQAAGLESAAVFDGGGRYALPGFIDTHVHLDSTLLTPEHLAEMIVPHGTTVMLADPMESANVGGFAGLQALLSGMQVLPYHLWLEVPSRVPTAPGLETTGGELGLETVEQILAWPHSISLGELDPSKVLGLRDEYLAKVAAAHANGKIANGHAAGLSGRELEAYVCGGLLDDHEAVDFNDALARLRLGLPVLVREGSTERNLRPILSGAIQQQADTRHLMFCTDDKHPDDILAEGHIDHMVNAAIRLGLPPVQAIQMATLNSAQHFHLDQWVGSLSPGRSADVLLVEDLQNVRPSHVFFRGRLVARDGQLTDEIPAVSYPDWFRHTVHVQRGTQAGDFRLPASGAHATLRVIQLYPDQIINRAGQAVLPVVDGAVCCDPSQDVLKLAVVERHGKNGNIGVTFVQGFGLQRGAIASSVAHDHHNLIIAGCNDADMAVCVRALAETQGGLAVAAGGELLGVLPLPLGGLMSDRPAAEITRRLQELTHITHTLGGTLPAPFMTLSFIGLPTIPDLGLTDCGLVDVRNHALISPFITE